MIKQLSENYRKQISTAIALLIILTVLTGVLYPLLVTAIAQVFFPWQANGSLIQQNGKTIGSVWIGQSFSDPVYFWGRPSATIPFPYNSAASSGSNLGPTNPLLVSAVKERMKYIQDDDSLRRRIVPVDLVTASGSGLDPDISPYAAFYQVKRIAKARHLPEAEIEALINQLISYRTLGILGEPRVNVLALNLALDKLRTPPHA